MTLWFQGEEFLLTLELFFSPIGHRIANTVAHKFKNEVQKK